MNNLTNPERHVANPAPHGPVPDPSHPVALRPITIVYSNESPFALTRVLFHGHELRPQNYTIDAKKGVITLDFHFSKVQIRIDEETK